MSVLGEARRTFRRGSRSFATAAMLLDAPARRDATLLYAWCRHCDDAIDGQRDGLGAMQPADRLAEITEHTRGAFGRGGALPGPFAGLREVVARHAVDEALVMAHLDGFRMDVEGRCYRTIEETIDYCWHVAGIVGLLMARIMGVTEEPVLRRAADLGIAFQLTNMVRDVVADQAAGRMYVPSEWLADEGLAARLEPDGLYRVAVRMLDLAEGYYGSARVGIAALPARQAWAIGSALAIYRDIGTRIRARGAAAWEERVHVAGWRKVGLVMGEGVRWVGSRQDIRLKDRSGDLPPNPHVFSRLGGLEAPEPHYLSKGSRVP